MKQPRKVTNLYIYVQLINLSEKGEHLEETQESTDTREQDESLSVGKNEFQAMEVTFYIYIHHITSVPAVERHTEEHDKSHHYQ